MVKRTEDCYVQGLGKMRSILTKTLEGNSVLPAQGHHLVAKMCAEIVAYHKHWFLRFLCPRYDYLNEPLFKLLCVESAGLGCVIVRQR